MLPPLSELVILKKMGLQVVLYHLKKIFTPNFNIILQKDCCVIDSLYSFQNVSAFVTISSYLLQNLNSSTLEVFFVVTELDSSVLVGPQKKTLISCLEKIKRKRLVIIGRLMSTGKRLVKD